MGSDWMDLTVWRQMDLIKDMERVLKVNTKGEELTMYTLTRTPVYFATQHGKAAASEHR